MHRLGKGLQLEMVARDDAEKPDPAPRAAQKYSWFSVLLALINFASEVTSSIASTPSHPCPRRLGSTTSRLRADNRSISPVGNAR